MREDDVGSEERVRAEEDSIGPRCGTSPITRRFVLSTPETPACLGDVVQNSRCVLDVCNESTTGRIQAAPLTRSFSIHRNAASAAP